MAYVPPFPRCRHEFEVGSSSRLLSKRARITPSLAIPSAIGTPSSNRRASLWESVPVMHLVLSISLLPMKDNTGVSLSSSSGWSSSSFRTLHMVPPRSPIPQEGGERLLPT